MTTDFTQKTNQELAAHAEHRAAQGAVVESMTRLRLTIEKNDKATHRLGKTMRFYTILLVVIAVFQV